jgi:uncharacterized membrane protein YfcA
MEMLTLLVWLGYLVTGLAAGLAAGLFGIGGGIIGVPALVHLLPYAGVDPVHVVHLAIGSSLVAILFTSGGSAWNHHRRGAVSFDLVRELVPGLLIGALLGGLGARFLDGDWLRTVFGLFACGVAVWLLIGRQPTAHAGLERGAFAVALAIGVLASLVGVGGGILLVPWLLARGTSPHTAIGTSAAATLPVALAGGVGYVISGLGVPGLPGYATGFVLWPAVAGISVGALLAAPWGVALAHRLPAARLRRVFAVLVVVMGVDLILG